MTILFFHFDGTCNDPEDAEHYHDQDVSITNVLKSHLLLGGRLAADSCTTRLSSGMMSFYYSGVGTYGSSLTRFLNAGLAVEQGDVADILRGALIDFQTYYHANISAVVLIGFSRGAALARRFAALINPFVSRPIVIEAVMDTVASIGMPNLDKRQRPTQEVVFEYGGTLPRCVNKALHLLALDEQRLAFRPTLMNQDGRVEEVWLSGVHADVGGGYRYDGLADISLTTMMMWLEYTLGLTLYKTAVKLTWPNITAPMLKITPESNALLHYQTRAPLYGLLTLAPRHCHVLKQGVPCPDTPPLWHSSVWMRQRYHSDYRPLARCLLKATQWQMTKPFEMYRRASREIV